MVYTKSNRKIIYNPRRKRIVNLRAAHSVSNFHNNYRIDEEQFLEMRREGITDFRRVWFVKGGTKSQALNLTPYVQELNKLYDPRRPLDLTEADLGGLEAEGIDLRGSKLLLTNLESANLRGADLSFCNLLRTRLSYASLYGANLRVTRLSEVWLNEALCLEGLKESDLPLDFGRFLKKFEGRVDYSLAAYEAHARDTYRGSNRYDKYKNNRYKQKP